MRTYAVRTGCIAPWAQILFDRLVRDFEAMPDLESPETASCHAVCRALSRRHPVQCIDGWFHAVGHDHSWLDLGSGVIADIYPIAGSGPFMVDASHFMVPWHRLYIPHPTLLDEGGRDRKHHEDVADILLKGLPPLD